MRRLTFVSSLVALAALTGCDDDPTRAGSACKDCPAVYESPTTPDIVIENLVKAFNERNYEQYETLLHEDFVFYFAPEDIDVVGQGASWDHARELESMESLFSGGAGRRPDGSIQPPVQDIILLLVPENPNTDWTDQVWEDFVGTLMRRYVIEMDVTYTDGNINEVTGIQEFYVVDVEVPTPDGPQTIYQVKFWRDLGKSTAKGTDSASLGEVKGRF